MSKNKKLEDTLHSEIRRLEGKIDELNGKIVEYGYVIQMFLKISKKIDEMAPEFTKKMASMIPQEFNDKFSADEKEKYKQQIEKLIIKDK